MRLFGFGCDHHWHPGADTERLPCGTVRERIWRCCLCARWTRTTSGHVPGWPYAERGEYSLDPLPDCRKGR